MCVIIASKFEHPYVKKRKEENFNGNCNSHELVFDLSNVSSLHLSSDLVSNKNR